MRTRPGYVELVTCGLVWGSIGVLVKRSPLPAPLIVFFRLSLGAVTAFVWHALRGRLREIHMPRRRGLITAFGMILAFHWVMFFLAYKRLSVATVILIVYVGPVFMALLAPVVLRERLERRTLASLGLSLAGIALISVPAARGHSAIGLAFAVFAMASFVALVFVGKVVLREATPSSVLVWQLTIAAVCVSPALVTARAHDLARSWSMLLLLGVVHTGMCGFLYFRAMRVVKAQHMGILAYLEPVTAVIWAWAALGERPGAATLAGAVLVIAAGANIALSGASEIPSAEMPEIYAGARP